MLVIYSEVCKEKITMRSFIILIAVLFSFDGFSIDNIVKATSGNLILEAATGSKIKVGKTVTTTTGDLVLDSSSSSIIMSKPISTSSGNLTLDAYLSSIVVKKPIITTSGDLTLSPNGSSNLVVTNGMVSTGGSANLNLDAAGSSIAVGKPIITNLGDMTLNPNGASKIILNKNTELTTGVLTSGAGQNITLTPATGRVSVGTITYVNAGTVYTSSGDLTLTPTSSIVLSKDVTSTTGKITSGIGVNLTLDAPTSYKIMAVKPISTTVGDLTLDAVAGSSVVVGSTATGITLGKNTILTTGNLTTAGNADLALTSAGTGVITLGKDTTLTTGNLTSGGGSGGSTALTLTTPGSGGITLAKNTTLTTGNLTSGGSTPLALTTAGAGGISLVKNTTLTTGLLDASGSTPLSFNSVGTGAITLGRDTTLTTGNLTSGGATNLALTTAGAGIITLGKSTTITNGVLSGGASAPLAISSVSGQNATVSSLGTGNASLSAAGTGTVSINSTTGAASVNSTSGNVSLNATAGTIALNSSGNISLTPTSATGVIVLATAPIFSAVRSATITQILTATDFYVLAGAASAISITLPTHVVGRTVTIKNTSTGAGLAGVVTVLAGAGTIDGQANFLLTIKYQSATFVSDGGNWYITQGSTSSGTITTVTGSPYAILSTDSYVISNSASSMVMTLPAHSVGKQITVKNINVGLVTINCGGGCDGAANATFVLAANTTPLYQGATFLSDGATWHITQMSRISYFQ